MGDTSFKFRRPLGRRIQTGVPVNNSLLAADANTQTVRKRARRPTSYRTRLLLYMFLSTVNHFVPFRRKFFCRYPLHTISLWSFAWRTQNSIIFIMYPFYCVYVRTITQG